MQHQIHVQFSWWILIAPENLNDLFPLFNRESAEDRLEKLQAAMEEFCAKYGSWEPTNS